MFYIKTLPFYNIEELCDYATDKFDEVKDNDCLNSVTIVAKYEEAKQILEDIINIGYTIASIDGLNSPDWNGYDDEFIIALSPTEEGDLWCEPFKKNGVYLTNECAIAFVLSNCNSKVISHLQCDESYEVIIDDVDDYCDCDGCDYDSEDNCKNCKAYELENENQLDSNSSESTYVSRDKDGHVSGFSKSWSDTKNGVSYYSAYSHYSSDEDAVRKIAADFGIRL